MKRAHQLTAFSIAAVLVLGGAYQLTRQPADAAVAKPAARAAMAVSVTGVSQVGWSRQISASGSVAPWQEAVIAAETGGLRIVKVAADVGDVVKRGQTLVALSRDSVLASEAQQRALVDQARAALAEAKGNADRARKVSGSGALSAQQVQQYLVAEQSAKANLAATQAALKSEQIRLGQTRITAPDDGIISRRSATLGSVVQSGTELFGMVRQGRLEWRAELSAEQLAAVAPGQGAQLRLADGSTVTGTVRMIAPTLNADSRKALVYVDLPAGSAARAGMFASGEILTGEARATVLPAAAVIMRDGHSYVFEVSAEGGVTQHRVDTGRRRGAQVEVLTALADDARIVASGGAFLNDGDLVRVEAASEAAPEATPEAAR
ncbi:MAG: efflux RND transporter periplasmic adaptor subunit [Denitromonas halophila]|nr:MAG: efflux RND transporter periplasmic adaptor subunit [Denitromonas halophila]